LYTRLFRLLKPQEISLEEVDGHKMYLDLRDPTCRRMAMFDFEPTTSRTIKEILKPGMTFFDIGAHVGYFTLQGARCVGRRGKVYAFEPEDKNFELLEKNAKANGYTNVIASKAAVSNKNGYATMFLSKDSALHSLKFGSGDKVEVRTSTLDSFCKKNKIKKIDLIKLDVEGGEMDALEGMKNAAKDKRLKMIIEYIPENFSSVGSSKTKFLRRLSSLGFSEFYLLDKKEIRKIDPDEILRLADGIYNILAEKS
jgi:FkbM family methyltransferase